MYQQFSFEDLLISGKKYNRIDIQKIVSQIISEFNKILNSNLCFGAITLDNIIIAQKGDDEIVVNLPIVLNERDNRDFGLSTSLDIFHIKMVIDILCRQLSNEEYSDNELKSIYKQLEHSYGDQEEYESEFMGI